MVHLFITKRIMLGRAKTANRSMEVAITIDSIFFGEKSSYMIVSLVLVYYTTRLLFVNRIN
jgi:hypothetical protein